MLNAFSSAVACAALFQPTGSTEIGLPELFLRRLGEAVINAVDVIISPNLGSVVARRRQEELELRNALGLLSSVCT